MLMLISLIVCSMTSLHAQEDSVKCFSIEDAKTLLIYAERGYLCDSLTSAYDNKIETLEQIIQNKDRQILLANEVIQSQRIEIDKLNRKIKWFRYGCAGLGAIAFVETLILILP